MMESTPAPCGVGQPEELHHDIQLRVETQVSICTTYRFGVTAQFSLHSAPNIGQGDLFEGTSGL